MATRSGRPISCRLCQHKFTFSVEEKEIWLKNELMCPRCGAIYCNLPPTERELKTYHKIFFAKESSKYERDKAMTKMYEILCSYAKSIILKSYGSKIFSTEQLLTYSHDAAALIIRRYHTTNDGVHTSYATMLSFKIKEVMFSKQEFTNDASLDELTDTHNIQFDQEITPIEQLQTQLDRTSHINSVIKNVSDLIFENIPQNNRLEILMPLNIFFSFGERVLDKYFKIYGQAHKLQVLAILDKIKKYLMGNI